MLNLNAWFLDWPEWFNSTIFQLYWPPTHISTSLKSSLYTIRWSKKCISRDPNRSNNFLFKISDLGFCCFFSPNNNKKWLQLFGLDTTISIDLLEYTEQASRTKNRLIVRGECAIIILATAHCVYVYSSVEFVVVADVVPYLCFYCL